MAWLMGTKILLNNTEPNESDYRLKSIHDIDDPNGFDECFSWSMNDLPTAYNGVNDYDDSKDDWDSYKDWSNANLDSMSNTLDNFLRFKYYTHQTYTQHNKVVLADGTILQGTDGEAALIKKDGVYKFCKIQDLVADDILIKWDKSETAVTSNEVLNIVDTYNGAYTAPTGGTSSADFVWEGVPDDAIKSRSATPVLHIGLKPADVYFIEGYCFHNSKRGPVDL